MQTPDEERLVREATTMEKWGPTAQQMKAISDLTYRRTSCPVVMDALMRRLSEPGKYWRHVYKALLVIDYALKNGSPDVAEYCRRHVIEIQTLQRYQHIDEDNKDQGINVRERAKLVLELVNDRHKLADERKRADASRNKYVGVSSDGASYSASYARGGLASSSSGASRYGSVAYDDPFPQGRDDRLADEADSRWGMAGDMNTDDLPAPEPAPAAAAEPAPAPAPAPAAQNLFDTEFSEPVAATNASAAPATSLFDALDMVPASSQPQQPQQQMSFFDMAPATTTAAPAPAQTSTTSFFAAPQQQAAPAPAPKSDPMSFFDMAPATTTAATSTSSTMAFSSFPSSTPASSSTSSAFGFTSAAPAAAAAPASAPKPAPAKNDPWGGLVNLDSLSAGASASTGASQTSKVPMAAMASAGTTGPAMRPMGASSMGSTGSVMQPTPVGAATLQPTRGPNYDALKPQYNPYMMQQQQMQQQQMLRMQQMQQMQQMQMQQQRYAGNGSAF